MKLNERKSKSVADLDLKDYITSAGIDVSSTGLHSLEGSPEVVDGYFMCGSNYQLRSLKGGPRVVRGNYYCDQGHLTSLEGAPQEVGNNFHCSGNNLKSLKDIHKIIRRIGNTFNASGNNIASHVLGLLLIKDLKMVFINNKEVEVIINRHLDGGSMRSAMDCQHELIKAGFLEFAKL